MYLDKRFDNSNKATLSYFEIFDMSMLPHACGALPVNGDKEIENLLEHFSAVLTEEEITEILYEWSKLKSWMAAYRRRNLLDLYRDLMVENPHHLSHLLVLVQMVLTLSPSTASCERGFSCMNRGKPVCCMILTRQTAYVKALSHLDVLASNGNV